MPESTWSKEMKGLALAQLEKRKAKAKTVERIDNSRLYAGSNMYYYCHLCGLLAAELPECHVERPPRFCGPCAELLDNGYSIVQARFP